MPRRAPAFLVVAGLALASAFVGAAAAAIFVGGGSTAVISHAAPWRWYMSEPQHRIYVGGLDGSSDLTLGTNGLTDGSDWRGNQITFAGTDGNFEFEHYKQVHESIITGQRTRGGVTTATPVAIGAADGQDLTPLIAAAGATGTHAVQVWDEGGHELAAIGRDGSVSINGIKLVAGVDPAGLVEVDAVLKNGTRQTLLIGRPS